MKIGRSFKAARMLGAKTDKITAFAGELGVDGAHLGRIEAGLRTPGPEYLAKILPYLKQAGEDPAGVLYTWLEAQGLGDYVQAIKRSKK